MKLTLFLLHSDVENTGKETAIFTSEAALFAAQEKLMREYKPLAEASALLDLPDRNRDDFEKAWDLWTDHRSWRDDYYSVDETEVELPADFPLLVAVQDFLALQPLADHELQAYCFATFIPALRAALKP